MSDYRCCDWPHVRACGPVTDADGNVADDMCACGCTAYDERCWIEAEAACDACSGSGIHGGPGGYYDAPGKGKPCASCDGTGVVRR